MTSHHVICTFAHPSFLLCSPPFVFVTVFAVFPPFSHHLFALAVPAGVFHFHWLLLDIHCLFYLLDFSLSFVLVRCLCEQLLPLLLCHWCVHQQVAHFAVVVHLLQCGFDQATILHPKNEDQPFHSRCVNAGHQFVSSRRHRRFFITRGR